MLNFRSFSSFSLQTTFFGFLFTFFCANASSPANAHVITIAHDLKVKDGNTLHLFAVVPEETNKHPVILLVTRRPFAQSRIEQDTVYAVPFGVAFVTQYMRGVEESKGKPQLLQQLKSDVTETVNWIRKQDWCNGRVILLGEDYQGSYAYKASDVLRDLHSQMIWFSTPILYNVFFRNGIYQPTQAELYVGKTNRTFLETQKEPHLVGSNFWKTRERTDWKEDKTSTVHLTGWFSPFVGDVLQAFTQQQQGTATKDSVFLNYKLIVGPWAQGRVFQPTQGDLTFPSNAKKIDDITVESFVEDWLLAYPLNTVFGIRSSPPVRYYVMGAVGEKEAPGNRWYRSRHWPPTETQAQTWYLQSKQRLSEKAPTEDQGETTFAFDPKDPVPTWGGATLFKDAGPKDQRPIEKRKDVLTFTSPELKEPLVILGAAEVKLWVTSDAKDTDFATTLTDVYPDGRSIGLASGIVRLRHAKSPTQEKLVPPGQRVEVRIPLDPTAYIVNKGHKLRLLVTSSNSPLYQPNSNTGDAFAFTPKETKIAKNTVFFQKDAASQLSLPTTTLKALEGFEPLPQPEPTPPEPEPEPTLEPDQLKENIDDGGENVGESEPNEVPNEEDAPPLCGCESLPSPMPWLLSWLILWVLFPRQRRAQVSKPSP